MIDVYVVMIEYGEIMLEDVPLPVRKQVEGTLNAKQN